MTFRSTRLERTSDKGGIAYGDLKIKGVTRQIALPVDFHGVIKDSVGHTRLGGSATLNINRLDYGIKWSRVLDNGSLVVDTTVQIELQFEAIKQGLVIDVDRPVDAGEAILTRRRRWLQTKR